MTDSQVRLGTVSNFVSLFVKSTAVASVLSAAVIPASYAQFTGARPDIQIAFGEVFRKPTLLGADVKRGRVDVVITNRGTAVYQGPINLNIYVSPDAILDKNPLSTPKTVTQVSTLGTTVNEPLVGTDEILGTKTIPSVNLLPGASTTVTVNLGQTNFVQPSVVAPGAYHLITEVDTTIPQATQDKKVIEKLVNSGDPVIVWNATLLNAILATGIQRENGVILARGGTPPPVATRSQAIVHVSVYDAVNSIQRIGSPYAVTVTPASLGLSGGANARAAASQAAYTALINLFPDPQLRPVFDRQLEASLAGISDGTAKDNGRAVGREVANQILKLRNNDGLAQALQSVYTGGSLAGEWQPSFPDFSAAALPGWGSITPFSSSVPPRDPNNPQARLNQFGLTGPAPFGSQQFVDEENLVRQVGAFRNTTVTTITRTSDQTKTALFWALDRANTFRPPGQWNQYAQQISLNRGATLAQNALLFAQLNVAQADVGILTWDSKYTYNQLRPIQAIRQDQRTFVSRTVRDTTWLPLISYHDPQRFFDIPLTPPFPDYNSGHAAFGAAAGQVLINFFGDNTIFSVPSQDLPGVALTFNTISTAVEANAASRIFGGVHVPSAAVVQVPVTRSSSESLTNESEASTTETEAFTTTTSEGSTSSTTEKELFTVNTTEGGVLLRIENDPEVQLGKNVADLVIKSFGN
ncbi:MULTISPECIES: vanadium-dependent haloperoxidase [unclassified Anabaena]|uniref:vanadium-dependent haloperoxidase n=1 Tax=unclassified Anabaena TaxID=2619674 RepID=UPI0039C5FAFC